MDKDNGVMKAGGAGRVKVVWKGSMGDKRKTSVILSTIKIFKQIKYDRSFFLTVMSKPMAAWLSTPIPKTIWSFIPFGPHFHCLGFVWVLVSAGHPLGIDGLGAQLWVLSCSFLLCSSSRRLACCSLMQSLKACTCGWHCRQSWCWAMHSCTA